MSEAPAAVGFTVGAVPRHHARVQPDRVALDDGQRRLTYAELEAQVDALARSLAATGLASGEIVGAFLPNCIEYVVVVLAAARAGAVFCPINARYQAREAAAILEQARPRLLFTDGAHAGVLAEALQHAGQHQTLVVDVQGESLAALLQHRAALPAVGDDTPFSLMFTSGTTGRPKGALATHRARMTWVLHAIIEYGLARDDVYLGTMPQVHSAGLTFTLMHLYAGATVRILPRFDAAAFLDIVEREGATSLLAVPTMLAAIVDELAARPQPVRLDRIRRLVSCGAPLPLPLKERVLRQLTRELYDYYGATESNSMTVMRPADQDRKPASVGQAFRGVELLIADAEGRPCATGTIGEVWCANPSAMQAYFGQLDATARSFQGRWYRTGDLGWLDEEGFLFLAGRQDDVVISGGVNIHPAEIEQVLLLHPAVADAAVTGVPDGRWGEVVKAFVVLREGAQIDLPAVQAHCRQHLADFKKPRALQVLDALPKNAAGKTLKTGLRAAEQRVP